MGDMRCSRVDPREVGHGFRRTRINEDNEILARRACDLTANFSRERHKYRL